LIAHPSGFSELPSFNDMMLTKALAMGEASLPSSKALQI